MGEKEGNVGPSGVSSNDACGWVARYAVLVSRLARCCLISPATEEGGTQTGEDEGRRRPPWK